MGVREPEQNYTGLDCLKILLAILVTDLHLSPLADICPDIAYILNISIDRIAVPTFFLISGFLFGVRNGGKITWGGAKKFVKRSFSLYVCWTIVYSPLIVMDLVANSKYEGLSVLMRIVIFIRRFFLMSSWTPLWFFLAGAYGMLLCYYLSRLINNTWILLLASFLFMNIFTIFGDCYFPLGRILRENNMMIDVAVSIFPKVFGTILMGATWATFYYILGIYLSSINRKVLCWIICLLISLFFLVLEVCLCKILGATVFSRMNSIIFVAISLVMIFSKVQIKNVIFCKYLRRIATLLYGFHCFYPGFIHIHNHFLLWIADILLSFLSATLIIILSEKTKRKIFYCLG